MSLLRAWSVRVLFVCAIVAAGLALGVAMGLFAGSRPGNLGPRGGRLAPCKPTPNCVSSQADAARDAQHYIAPLSIGGDAPGAWAALRSILRSTARVRIVTDRDGYIYAQFTSRVMGFVDDVEFLLDAKAGVIQVRSASRLGVSDFGVNRARIEAIRAKLAHAIK